MRARPVRKRRGRTALVIAAIVLVVGAGVALVALPSLYEVVDSGYHLRPYPSGEVYQVRMLNSATLYVDGESQRAGIDLLSGVGLVALATACGMAFLLLTAAGAHRRLRWFYAVACVGLGLLALDELVALHETVGHNLPFLTDLPGVERPDDVIFAAYALPALAFVVCFRDVLADSALAVRLFGAAVVLFVLSGVADVAGLPLDDPLEILVALAVAGGLVELMRTHLLPVLCVAPVGARASGGA